MYLLLNYNAGVCVNALIQFICGIHLKASYVCTLDKCSIFYHSTFSELIRLKYLCTGNVFMVFSWFSDVR